MELTTIRLQPISEGSRAGLKDHCSLAVFISSLFRCRRPVVARLSLLDHLLSEHRNQFLRSAGMVRYTVPRPNLNCAEIARQESPCFLSSTTLEGSTFTGGRPIRLPLAFALRSPALTRS